MHLIPVTPTGLPALAVILVSFVLFVGALLIARLRKDAPGETGAKRDRGSIIGVAVQTFGIFAVGVGTIHVALSPTSPLAVGEAAAVALLMAGAIGLFFAASRTMGSNWSIVARTRPDHDLVTSGPFAHVRHPIYVALFLFMVAMAVAYGHYWGLVPGVPLYIVGTIIRVRIEERMLRAQFGTAYDAYAARVKRFVPGLI